MAAVTWVRHSLVGAVLAATLSPSSLPAREGVRTIPLAAVAPLDHRNMADPRPAAADSVKSTLATGRGELTAVVNRAKVIKLPEKTQTVIIGNPGVADISIQKNGIVVLTGKSFGVTNFIALDANGAMIGESTVSVSAPTDATVMVQRGLERQTYSCTPVCQPSIALGDAPGYFAETKGQIEQHSAFVGHR